MKSVTWLNVQLHGIGFTHLNVQLQKADMFNGVRRQTALNYHLRFGRELATLIRLSFCFTDLLIILLSLNFLSSKISGYRSAQIFSAVVPQYYS